MLKTRVIPCLLIRDLGLVKTVQFKKPTYVGDPINAVRIFNEKEVDELIFLDIMASRKRNTPNFKLIAEIAAESFMPFSYGGGIRDMSTIQRILRNGAEKVILNSYAVENPGFIREAAQSFGGQSIVLSIDVKKRRSEKYEILTYSGRKATDLNPVDFVKQAENMGVGEIMVNSIDRDGTMTGYDIKLIRMIADSTTTPLIACGGAGNISHFTKAIWDGHASAVAAGSLFVFYGPRRAVLINYPQKKSLVGICQ